MSGLLKDRDIDCPYCGETFVISIDCSAGNQEYIEDCYVCCKPITIQTNIDNDGNLENLVIRREDE